MEIKFNVTGPQRKQLVGLISEVAGWKAEYQGMPSAAYKIEGITVSKEGTVTFDGIDAELIAKITEAAKAIEFEAENAEEPTGLTISVPLDKVGTDNLTNLLEAKGELIKKALGTSNTNITIDEEKVSFPWFDELPEPDEINAYTQFIGALCKMSKEQKRISAAKKEPDNEKYAFRCFLLRLGFIGDEYKKSRKILLKNLSGSSEFKNAATKEAQ